MWRCVECRECWRHYFYAGQNWLIIVQLMCDPRTFSVADAVCFFTYNGCQIGPVIPVAHLHFHLTNINRNFGHSGYRASIGLFYENWCTLCEGLWEKSGKWQLEKLGSRDTNVSAPFLAPAHTNTHDWQTSYTTYTNEGNMSHFYYFCVVLWSDRILAKHSPCHT